MERRRLARQSRSGAGKDAAGSALGTALLLVVGGLVILPIGFVIYGALTSAAPGSPEAEFTLENFSRVFFSAEFLRVTFNSLLLGLVVGFTSLVVGTLMAWLVAKTGLRRAGIWEYLLVLPVYLSPLMLALAFVAMAAPRVGFLNFFLPGDGVDIYTFGGMVWVLTLCFSGYVFLYMLGPMRSLNAELEEAAIVLGSSRLQTIRLIVLPLLGPAMVASFVIVATLAAENFAVPSLLGGRVGFDTLTTAIYYNVTFEPTNPNLAAAQGLMLLLITLSGIAIYRRMVKLSNRYVTVGGKGSASTVFALRKFRWVPASLITVWLIIGIALPMGGLVLGSFLSFISPTLSPEQFTLANYEQVFRGNGMNAIRNSIVLALLAATITALLGALVSYAVQRTRAPGRGVLDYLSSATVAIPGMTLALGLLWTYVRFPGVIWGSIVVLLIAYITRFISHGTRITSLALLPISPQLEESAQVLGAGLIRRLRTITLPLMRNGIMSAWVLVFIFAINEVSATVLLYSPRSLTIAMAAWNAAQTTGSQRAFAFAAIQCLIVAIFLIIAYRFIRAADSGNVAVVKKSRKKAKGANRA